MKSLLLLVVVALLGSCGGASVSISVSRNGPVIGWRQYGEIPPQYWP